MGEKISLDRWLRGRKFYPEPRSYDRYRFVSHSVKKKILRDWKSNETLSLVFDELLLGFLWHILLSEKVKISPSLSPAFVLACEGFPERAAKVYGELSEPISAKLRILPVKRVGVPLVTRLLSTRPALDRTRIKSNREPVRGFVSLPSLDVSHF